MDYQWDTHSNLSENHFTFPHRRDIEVPNVMAVVGNLKGKAVLDYGCGPGNYARLLKMNGAERVVGYDISQGMLKRAKQREEKEKLGINYVYDITPDLYGQFDLLLTAYVLPYAFSRKDLHTLCYKMARVIRPGGRLVAVTFHPNYDTDPNYYDAFGVRFVADKHHVDGQAMIAEFRRPPYFDQFKVCYWSQASMDSAFRDVGFCEVRWPKPTLYSPCPVEEAPEYVRDFMAKPRFAIVDCFLPK